jgi:hypothetical protein
MRKTLNILLAAALTLGAIGAWECAGAPKSECSTGSRKASHSGGKTKLYECHNQSWVGVTCFDGTKKYVTRGGRTTAYICRSNEWVRGG